MNKNIIKLIGTVVIIVGLIIAGVFGGYQWSEADHAKRVTELQKVIYNLGITIQNESNAAAESNRELKIANRGRIDAIKINDHNTDTIKKLQSDLNRSANTLADMRRYIVLNVSSVKRVYDQSRDECNGLPGSIDPAIVPARISEFTGDSITGVVRDLVGRYCSVATDYNSLYATCETLLTGKVHP